jgi:hypothetical protein
MNNGQGGFPAREKVSFQHGKGTFSRIGKTLFPNIIRHADDADSEDFRR